MRAIRTLKELAWLLFGVIIPGLIFLSPIAISWMSSNWWYMFLFFVTWLPAIVIAKFIAFLHENL